MNYVAVEYEIPNWVKQLREKFSRERIDKEVPYSYYRLKEDHQRMLCDWWVKELLTITPEDIEAWRRESEAVNVRNNELWNKVQAVFAEAKKQFLACLARNSKEAKYVSNITCPSQYPETYNVDSRTYLLVGIGVPELNSATGGIVGLIAAARRIQQQTENLKQQQVLKQKAVEYLNANGLLPVVNYDIDNPIAAANDHAFQKAIEKIKAEGQYIPFSGDDNCENCRGWMPGEHRCDCGNRRVSFSSYGYSFLRPDDNIYAEAH